MLLNPNFVCTLFSTTNAENDPLMLNINDVIVHIHKQDTRVSCPMSKNRNDFHPILRSHMRTHFDPECTPQLKLHRCVRHVTVKTVHVVSICTYTHAHAFIRRTCTLQYDNPNLKMYNRRVPERLRVSM
jgi:hypothetical protein